MSDEKENVVVEAAAHLLAHRPRHRTEGNVQSDVEALLRAMRVGTIESHYQLGSDQADIYLPNRRTFIECKPYPKVPARDAACHDQGVKGLCTGICVRTIHVA